MTWILLIGFAPGALSAEPVVLGNDVSSGPGVQDGWSVLVINETDSYTNTTGREQLMGVTNFSFYARVNRGRVTPFVVRVHANNDFTVIAIGQTRQSGVDYNRTGTHSFPFADPYPLILLQPGDSIAAGFLDGNADGTGYEGSSIPYQTGGDEIWYTGGPDLVNDGGSIVLNEAPVHGSRVWDLNRNYPFQIQLTADPYGPEAPTDIGLQPAEVFPGMPIGTVVGTLNAVDVNPADTHTYALVSGIGDTDNARFTMDGDVLRTADAIGLPGVNYLIRVRATDSSGPPGLSFEKSLTIRVVNPQAPTGLAFSSPFISRIAPLGSVVGVFHTMDPNANDVHAYHLVAGAGDTHNALFRLDGDRLVLSQPLPAATTNLTLRVQTTDLSGYTFQEALPLRIVEAIFRLNEIAAANGSYEDEDRDTPDWIEIQNLTGSPQSLAGWYLTDEPDNLARWQFPNVVVPGHGFLIVFASGKNRVLTNGAPLHTNFRLDSGGEYLALVLPDGITIADQYNPEFPQQGPGVSYGFSQAGDARGYLYPPTPGAPNPIVVYDQGRNEVQFDPPRGLFNTAISLTLTSTVPGSVIRYTINGTKPTETTGMVYTGPITVAPDTVAGIRGTRRIRAVAIHSNSPPGIVATHTYVFINGVSGNPASDGVLGQAALSPAITQHPDYGPLMDEALAALPVVSIVKSGGVNQTEEEASIEFFDPAGREPGFQVDCGIKAVGGQSLNSPKNNFRLLFRSEYGTSRLRYPLFKDQTCSADAASTFQQLQLRSGSHDNFYWLADPAKPPVSSRHGDAQYVRNRWINDMHLQMGQPAMHGRFVQVYLNGAYHGQYHIMERPTQHFQASYFGGEDEDYHFTNAADPNKAGSDYGGGDNWQAAWASLKSSLGDYAAARQWIDMENLVDYMLLNFYTGNSWDWRPNQNWMAAGPKAAGQGGWKFYCWDADIILQDVQNNNLTKNVPDGVFQALLAHDEFRILLRDRIYRHFFNQGVLTPENAIRTYAADVDLIYTSLVAETARWQPATATSLPWDRDGEWWAEYQYLTNVFFPQRTAIVLDQFRAAGWYPVEAPRFSQPGGLVDPGFLLGMSHDNAGGTIYYTVDGTDPRLPGGALAPSARPYANPVVLGDNVHVRARVREGTEWSAQAEATFTTGRFLDRLAITEIMYHPPNQGLVDGEAFEFLELRNTGPVTLDLSGVFFSDGIQFAFTNGTSLGPGNYLLLGANAAQFAQKYPGLALDGVYAGNLRNSGETLTLRHALLGKLWSVTFQDHPPWPLAPDGHGFSLVPILPGSLANPDAPAYWRASTQPGGSPGMEDPLNSIPAVVINEILARPVNGLGFIELFNPTADAVDIGGWYLTDTAAIPRKFRVPSPTMMAAGGYAVFDESSFNATPGIEPSFSLNPAGGEVYLFSGDAAGELTGYSHGFEFAATAPGVALGRHLNSAGDEQFPAQITPSPLAANPGPWIGPVVINEIMYHPPDLSTGDNSRDEYIEWLNRSTQSVALYNPGAPTNTWRLRGGVDFELPANQILAAGEFLLLVNFDPLWEPLTLDDFRARHQLPPSVKIFGPYRGKLDNSGERISIKEPVLLDSGAPAYRVVDQVDYRDATPWPAGADGYGLSLQRLEPAAYGNEPGNWMAGFPSAAGRTVVRGVGPVILTHPQDQISPHGREVRLSVAVTGTLPLHFQWSLNGDMLPGETNSLLLITNIQMYQAGDYEVVVFNQAGSLVSDPATVRVTQPPRIIGQPQPLVLAWPGTNVSFTVTANSLNPITYQWWHQGTPIPGATNATLTMDPVLAADDGEYLAAVTDRGGTIYSEPGRLSVLLKPVIRQPPLTQTVVEGSDVTFSVEIDGNPPPFLYQWRYRSLILTNFILNERQCFFTLNNVSTNDATAGDPFKFYRIAITNAASPGITGTHAEFDLAVLPDSDRDGLPDEVETAMGYPDQTLDGNGDNDGDGLTNREEYLAGTDPQNPDSYLAIDGYQTAESTWLTFGAISNRTYSVQYLEDLRTGAWQTLADIPATPTNRVIQVQDPAATSPRYYRVVMPKSP